MEIFPLAFTPIAEKRMKRALSHGLPEPMDATLMCSDGYNVTLGWFDGGTRPKESFYDILGFPVSVEAGALEHLIGRTLDVTERYVESQAGLTKLRLFTLLPTEQGKLPIHQNKEAEPGATDNPDDAQ